LEWEEDAGRAMKVVTWTR